MADDNNKKIREYMAKTGHTKPVSRRDFLGAGLIPFSISMMAPNLASFLLSPSQVLAAADINCPTTPLSTLSPLINIHLAGGAALPANLIALDMGGQLLPSYNKLGLGNSSVPIDYEFNHVPFAGNGIAKILAGIRAQTSPATRAKTAFASICVLLRDDSQTNTLDISGLSQAAGLVGTVLPNLGNGYSEAGSSNAAAIKKPTPPLIVRDINSIQLALRPQVNHTLSNKMQQGLMRVLASLTKEQSKQFEGKSGSDVLTQATYCGLKKNDTLMSNPNMDISPLENKTITDAWGIQLGAPNFDIGKISATLVYNALKGNTGHASISLGGYDYHGSARDVTDAMDFEAGKKIGATLETAAILGKKLFLYITSDGTVGTSPSDSRSADFSGDYGQAGTIWMMAFDPAGRPSVKGHQLGYFNSSQGAADQTLVGSSAEMAGAAVFANYLSFNKAINKFRAAAGPRPFAGTGELDQVVTLG